MCPNLQVGLRNATTALSALSSRKQKDYAEQIRLTLGRIREVVVALVGGGLCQRLQAGGRTNHMAEG